VRKLYSCSTRFPPKLIPGFIRNHSPAVKISWPWEYTFRSWLTHAHMCTRDNRLQTSMLEGCL
jgi:hypothetical protein